MKKVNEVSRLAGVSKRTLQFYDDEGLLPAQRSKDNYRLYDDAALERLWEILVYRAILESFKEEGIEAEDCSFWGDEFVGIQEGLYGSDSFMLTPKTEEGDFFDVSSLEGVRPEKIQILGGGVDRFIQFLVDQGK